MSAIEKTKVAVAEKIARPRGERTEIRNEMSANAECADGDMAKQAEEYLNSAECNEQVRPAADKTRGDGPSERQTEQEGDQDDAETLGRTQPQVSWSALASTALRIPER